MKYLLLTLCLLAFAGTATAKPNRVLPARAQAPELDARSGTAALALLTGVLLLAGERVRERNKAN